MKISQRKKERLHHLSNMLFWNKKDEEIERLNRIILSNVEIYNQHNDLTKTKLDLILDHLKLKYIPETETKEPAKLVEKTVDLGPHWGSLMDDAYGVDSIFKPPIVWSPIPPKKKGRPKKK